MASYKTCLRCLLNYIWQSFTRNVKKHLDSVEVKNNEYQFKGELTVDEAIAVLLAPPTKTNPANDLTLYIDKGELNVISDGVLKKIHTVGSGAAAQIR